MANNNNMQGTSAVKSNIFTTGMNKDISDIFIPEGVWTNAINAINNSHYGHTGAIGNEQSNLECTNAPYTIIGIINKSGKEWVVFSTNNTDSEIGIFNEAGCNYQTVVNDRCLNFNTKYIITGAAKENADCTYQVYWQDNNNPDRTMNLDNPPYVQIKTTDPDNCNTITYTDVLDCDKLRLAALVSQPCIQINKSKGSGQLANGSYQATIAYSQNGIRITDYATPSVPQGLWSHTGIGGSLDITIENIDNDFEEYELVIVSVINQQTVAKKVGNYSTSQTKVHIDQYLESLPVVQLNLIPLKSVVYEKSKKMFEVGSYLVRTSVTTQPYFNYQPLANQIRAEWVAVQYPKDYYWKGGNNTGYMRDEVYSFFIRWVYNTGARSASFHIPGRASLGIERTFIPLSNPDVIEAGSNQLWQVYDTSTITSASGVTKDGGQIIAKGNMGYWESSERYPDLKPEIWGNLCNKPIRHHKMPSNETIHIHDTTGDYINILGVNFSNIKHPLDDNGNPITEIVGYEILRGSREGNRSIIAKGLLNNLLEFPIQGSTKKGLMQNYPYNDLRPDPYLNNVTPLQNYFSFNSPETSFVKPYIGDGMYLKVYTNEIGTMSGVFQLPYNHPKFKVITDGAFLSAALVATGLAIMAVTGKINSTQSNTGITRSQLIPGSALGGFALTSFPTTNFDSQVSMGYEGGKGTSVGDFTTYNIFTLANTPTTGAAGLTAAGSIINLVSTIANAAFYAYEATQQVIEIIRTLIPFRNYVLQFNSHGFYNSFGTLTNAGTPPGFKPSFTRNILAKYISSGLQDFNSQYRINNKFRTKFVGLQLSNNTTLPNPNVQDQSKVLGSTVGINTETIKTISSYYGAIKAPFVNQYGQLESIIQIPTDSCVLSTIADKNLVFSTTEPVFGGDVYINRYTEKNAYPFFNTWLYDVPDGIEFNYNNYINGPQPVYYANFENFDVSDFSINGISLSGINITTPSDFRNLNDFPGNSGTFSVKNKYMYLFNNGIRDFFVESELNMAYRDYGENDYEKFYDPYGDSFSDYSEMFRSNIIDKPVYYKYDYSLSTSKLYSNFASWGYMLPSDYDPLTYNSCFQYLPSTGVYSLEQQEGSKRDSWRTFLPLNYYQFDGVVTSIKGLNANGSIILYEDASPSQFVGVDTLQTTAGTKITIGDGGLFANNVQSIVNAEDAFNYGSSISNRAVLNTPYGLFWVSQNSGKIFSYGGSGLEDITKYGMKYWFLENLPSKLLERFPDFTEYDNPVSGIACQAIYDAQYELIYFTKKDYIPKSDCIGYNPSIGFYDACNPLENIVTCDTRNGYTFNTVTGLCEKIVSSQSACPSGYEYNPATQNCEPLEENYPLMCPDGYSYNPLTQACEKPVTVDPTVIVETLNVADIIILKGAMRSQFASIPRMNHVIQSFADYFEDDLNNVNGIRINSLVSIQSTSSTTPSLFKAQTVYPGGYGSLDDFVRNTFVSNTTTGYTNLANVTYMGLLQSANYLTGVNSRTNAKKIIIYLTDHGPDIQTATLNYGYQTCVTCGSLPLTSSCYDCPVGVNYFGNSQLDKYSACKSLTTKNCLVAAIPSLKIYVINVREAGYTAEELDFYNRLKNMGSLYNLTDANLSTKTTEFLQDLQSYIQQTATTIYECPPGYQYNPTSGLCESVVSVPTVSCSSPCQPTLIDDNYYCVCPVGPSIPTLCGTNCTVTTTEPYNCRCVLTEPPIITPTYIPISLDDEKYFDKANWTISFDPKLKTWISFHDWHPNFMIHSDDHFLTVDTNTFWRHNVRTDSFCNFYGKNYPWEIEYPVVTPNMITTLRNIEYTLEAYQYYNNGKDMFHVLDENFDRGYVYNTEQVSPLLSFKMKDKNNPTEFLGYPAVGVTTTTILASKEENKYRINTFYDITKDRHEFPSANPVVPMFITLPDGYHKVINPAYVDVNKPITQRKKFRHYGNRIVLRKNVSNNKKFILKLVNTKLLNSSR